MEPVDSPSEFEQRVLQTPDLARIEEIEYDSAESMVEYRVFLSSSLAQRIRADGEGSAYHAAVERLENLGAESVQRIGDTEVIVEFPITESV